MPCCTLGYAQEPVNDVHGDATPEDEYSSVERAARAGSLRNPQPTPVGSPGAPGVDAPDASILQRVLGVFKPARHPVPTLNFLRPYTGQGSVSQGSHVELEVGAAIPPQGMDPTGGYRENTWRARPQPWDTADYVGVR